MTDVAADGGAVWEVHRDGGFIDSIGPLMIRRDESGPSFGLQTCDRHVNRHGVVHGGVVMSFIDHALGIYGWEANGRQMQVTMQLGVNFVAAVTIGDFMEARCEVIRQTRSVMFLRATVLVGQNVVATGEGIWKLKRATGGAAE